MRRWFLLGCALIALARPALAADLEAGKAALAKGQYDAALKELLPLAMRDTAEAAFQMGRIHENGWGQPVSDSAAWGWYKRAADAGHLDAQQAVAQMFQDGRGVPRSTRLAYRYWDMAARQGSLKAKARTGVMTVAGLGRKRNHNLGLKLLHEAAAAGDPEAVAALDDLAGRGLAAAPTAGDTDPQDPGARAAIEAVRGLLDGHKIGGRIGAAAIEGGWRVTVPRLELIGDTNVLRVGTLRLDLKKAGADIAFEAILPGRMTLLDRQRRKSVALTIGQGRLHGIWQPGSADPADLELLVSDIQLRDAGQPWQSTAAQLRLTHTRHPGGAGRHDIASVVELRGLRLSAAKQGGLVTLDRALVRADLHDADLAAAERFGMMLWLGERKGRAPVPDNFDLLNSASVAIALEGLDGVAEGRKVALDHMDLTLTGADLGGKLSSATLSYNHAGARGGEPALPAAAEARLTVERIPIQALVAATLDSVMQALAAGAPEPATDALMATMAQAGTMLRLDRFKVVGPDWEVGARGGARPAPDGMSGAVDLWVRGLDALLAVKDGPLSMLDAAWLRKAAIPAQDEEGRPVSRFQLVWPAGGGLLVNGKDPFAVE